MCSSNVAATAGTGGLLGGRIEKGESVEQAAVREVKEESGLDVRITRLLGVYSDPAQGRIVAYSETDIIQLVDVVVEAEILGGELTRSAESEELRFFALDELPREIVPSGTAGTGGLRERPRRSLAVASAGAKQPRSGGSA